MNKLPESQATAHRPPSQTCGRGTPQQRSSNGRAADHTQPSYYLRQKAERSILALLGIQIQNTIYGTIYMKSFFESDRNYKSSKAPYSLSNPSFHCLFMNNLPVQLTTARPPPSWTCDHGKQRLQLGSDHDVGRRRPSCSLSRISERPTLGQIGIQVQSSLYYITTFL